MNRSAEALSPDDVWTRAAQAFDRWAAGDRGALDQLVRVMTPILWHTVRAYGLDKDHADDVVQATWLILVQRRDSVRDSRAVGGWLTTTARREAWRVAKREAKLRPVEDEALEDKVARVVSPESEVIENDRNAQLWRAVNELSERCQRLLRVVAFADRPQYGELAEELDMPVGSIGPTRRRCLDKLRQLMHERTGESG